MIPRLLRIGILSVLATVIGAGTAAGSVIIGQVAPGVPTSCANSFEFLEVSTPDNSYAMPATGTITSWTHRSQSGVGQTPTLKIFRKIGEPATYRVVGHDGPHAIAANTVGTFQANVPVQAGDVLGLTGAGGAVNIGCLFSGPGSDAYHSGNLMDGGFGDFTLGGANTRLNVSAVLTPDNSFTVGTVKRNKKKGTARLTVTVPNPGELATSAGGAKVSSAKSVQAGPVKLTIKAKGRRKKTLEQTGKVKISLAIAYTPTGGEPSSRSVKVKLRKK